MEENLEAPTVKSVAMKWGAISGILGVVFFLTLTLTGVLFTPGYSYIGLLPFLAVLYLAHKEFKDSGDGYMSYSEGLKIGFVVSLIGGLLLAAFSFVYAQYIDPTMMDSARNLMIEQWEKQGMSDKQIEDSLNFVSFMFNPLLGFIAVVIKNIIAGFILSLIVGAITKNNNPELDY